MDEFLTTQRLNVLKGHTFLPCFSHLHVSFHNSQGKETSSFRNAVRPNGNRFPPILAFVRGRVRGRAWACLCVRACMHAWARATRSPLLDTRRSSSCLLRSFSSPTRSVTHRPPGPPLIINACCLSSRSRNAPLLHAHRSSPCRRLVLEGPRNALKSSSPFIRFRVTYFFFLHSKNSLHI